MDYDTAFRVASLVAQASIPIAVFLAGRAIAKAQYTKSAQDAWNEFNKLVLASDENLKVACKYLRPPKFVVDADEEKQNELMRKAFMAFVMLNTFSGFYSGSRHKLVDKPFERAVMKELLAPLLEDEDIFNLSQNRGYHPEFRAFCRQLRESPSAALIKPKFPYRFLNWLKSMFSR